MDVDVDWTWIELLRTDSTSICIHHSQQFGRLIIKDPTCPFPTEYYVPFSLAWVRGNVGSVLLSACGGLAGLCLESQIMQLQVGLGCGRRRGLLFY